MLKVQSRADLQRLQGEKPKAATVTPLPPKPAPAPAPEAADQSQRALRLAVERLGEKVDALAQAKPGAKRLEAEVQRDAEGRMQKVIITVKESP
jgi:hypothetical protein